MTLTTPLIFVGLGNPGSKYSKTHHNLGFEVVDELTRRWKLSGSKKFDSEYFQMQKDAQKVLLLKPQTFMNLSGKAVAEAANFFKVAPEQGLFVITDDLDLPPGQIRLRLSGGSGGHNGLNSIIECLGTESFSRLRIGIGRHPVVPADVHVLAKIPSENKALFEESVKKAADAAEMILKEGFTKAMNQFNRKEEVKK